MGKGGGSSAPAPQPTTLKLEVWAEYSFQNNRPALPFAYQRLDMSPVRVDKRRFLRVVIL